MGFVCSDLRWATCPATRLLCWCDTQNITVLTLPLLHGKYKAALVLNCINERWKCLTVPVKEEGLNQKLSEVVSMLVANKRLLSVSWFSALFEEHWPAVLLAGWGKVLILHLADCSICWPGDCSKQREVSVAGYDCGITGSSGACTAGSGGTGLLCGASQFTWCYLYHLCLRGCSCVLTGESCLEDIFLVTIAFPSWLVRF